ncbi:MAG: Thermophilic serine proteinase precursor, partial [Phycisphaerales bacterium]|nr:Thermophilic serine proteinase precursor [Phycisphaerales bacterium]
DDNYTLTLMSGPGGFQDAAGNDLDGEPHWPMPPGTSGNGTSGGNFFVDFSMDMVSAAYPTPLTPLNPPGSLIYDPSAVGVINNAGDTDSFTLNLDVGQKLSVAAHPLAGGLQPMLTLYGPGSVVLGSGSAGVPGGEAILQTLAVATAGTYTVTVNSVGGTIGAYTLQLVLNAALEAESQGGASNNTPGSAQNIDPSFISLGGAGQRGAVLGTVDTSVGVLPAETEPNNSLATANNASANFTSFSNNLYHLGLSGTLLSSSDTDWYKLGAMQAGDVLTISDSGSSSSRGALPDSYVELYRAGSTIPVTFDDDNGPGTDSLIYRFTVTTADTYYVAASGFGGSFAGAYQLGIYLENTGPVPTTGGTVTTETEPNTTQAAATDASSSWRAVQYRSETNGSITSADVDYSSYQFTAGDLVSINIKPTGPAWAPKVALLNASGTVIASDDGTSVTNGNLSPLYGFIIPSTGTYFVRVQGYSGTGAYTSDIYLSTSTPPPMPVSEGDYFSLTLAAGQSLTFAATALAAGNLNLTLVDAAGNVLATGAAGATNVSQFISDYLAPSAGTYYVRVGGDGGLSYSVLATRGAEFDSEPNDTLASAQSIDQTRMVLGSLSGTDDYYSFSAAAGSTLMLATTTPGDGAGEFGNTLNPRLELYDPTNTLVASDDNSGPDGRNAFFSYLVSAGGVYKVRVAASGGTSGEYVLIVGNAAIPVVGAFAIPGAPEGAATAPVTGSFIGQAGDSFTATVDYGEGAGPQALALSGNTFTLSHAYLEGGSYAVSVVVTDTTTHLASAPSSANVGISDVAVIATIKGAPATISLGGSVSLNFTATNPNALETGPLIESWTILDGSNTVVASGTGGPFSFTPGAVGVYTVTFSAGESAVTDAETGTATATITVNPAPPTFLGAQIDDGNKQRSIIRSLTFTFSSPVTLSAGAITLALLNTAGSKSGTNDGAPPTDASSALGTPTSPNGGFTWVVPIKAASAFSAFGSLTDGVYTTTVHASLVTDAYGQHLTGADQTKTFHRLFGDVNGDMRVNATDYQQFTAAFGSSNLTANYLVYFDYNHDNRINANDYQQFSANFGKFLRLPTT